MRQIAIILTFMAAALSSMANSILENNRYNVSFLDMKAGLPHNWINAVYEDSHGFVWVATYGGGIVRYDGYGFTKTFSPELNIQMQSNSCRSIAEDRFNRLWVVFDEGVSVISLKTYNNAGAESFGTDISDILQQEGTKVMRDAKDNIWLLAGKKAYKFVFDEEGHIKHKYSAAFTSNTPDIAIADIDGDGTAWASIDGGVYKLTVEHGKLAKHPVRELATLFNKAYFTGFMRHNGDLWVGTNMGLFRHVTATEELRQYTHDGKPGCLAHDFVTCIATGPTGKLMIGSLGGVNIYDHNSDGFSYLRADEKKPGIRLSSNFVHCIYVKNGNVWIGTDNGGITKFSLSKLNLENITHRDGDNTSLSPNCVNATFVENDGTLWVGTVDGGLNRRAAGEKPFTHLTTANSQLTHNSVSTLTANGRTLWIGTWGGGVYWLDMDHPDRLTRLDVQPKYMRLIQHIGALAFDKLNNGLWIGSNDGIFFYDMRTRQMQMPFDGCDLVRGCIGSLIDNRQRLWIGCMTGMRVINLKSHKNGKFTCDTYMYKLDNPDSRLIDKITCFCQTRDGNIYLGSNGNGIYMLTGMKNGKMQFKAYNTQDGLANNSVKGIVEGMFGRLWIATNNGLSVMNPKDGAFSNYSETDGLLCSQFYWNAAVTEGNYIYLGSEKGLTAINVNEMRTNDAKKVTLTSLLVDNTPVLSGSSYIDYDISSASRIRLHESDKSFEISFSTLSYADDRGSVYCYRMKGFEEEWIQTKTGEHSVRYTNLPPGHYTFEVKCLSALSEDEGNVTSIEVTVSPYFYKTWWFMLIAAIVLALIITRLYKTRIETLKREEGERMLKPIRNALESAENPTELQSRIQNILENQRHFLNSTAKSAEVSHEKELKNAHNFMEDMFKAMEEGYMNSGFDIEQLAESMKISRTQLTKKLKEETGLTVSQLLKDYRLNIAREILTQKSGNRNITEIAYSVGFNDPKYFTRCFTKKYGISPSGYMESVDKNDVN